jgi:hypothetical protein
MRAGKNIWKCDELQGCGHEFRAEERPQECPQCGLHTVHPKVNLKRVHGHAYKYYRGNSEWELSANEALKREANRNFRNGKNMMKTSRNQKRVTEDAGEARKMRQCSKCGDWYEEKDLYFAQMEESDCANDKLRDMYLCDNCLNDERGYVL